MRGSHIKIYDEQRLDNDPRLIGMCLSCNRVTCSRGECEEVKALRRSISPFSAVYKHRGQEYELNGKSQTISQWAKEYHITEKTLRKRIKEGMPLEQALQLKVRAKNKVHLAFGKRQGVLAWAEEYGINPYTIYARLDKGMTMEEALTKPVKSGGGRKKNGLV